MITGQFCTVTQNHIYIFGDIYNDQSQYASDYGIISLRNVVDQINSIPAADELVVHIHSRGGDVSEGFAIYDALVGSGKKVTTIIEGLCASIATVPALAGSTRKMTENSDLMIHNPWGDPFSMDGFTADDYEKRAEEIRVAEDKLVAFYIKHTGADESLIRSMMNDETFMQADKALEMKFITDIVTEVKAMALLKGKSTNQNKTQMSKSKQIIDSLKSAIKALGGSTALTLSTTDGKSLEIVQDGDTPKEGSEVKIDNKAATDGDYILSSGQTITVAGGKITKVEATPAQAAAPAPAAAAPDTKELDNLKTENASLKSQLAALQAKVTTTETEQNNTISEMNSLLASLKAMQSKFKPDERTAAPTGASGIKTEPASRAAAAVERAKERLLKEKEKQSKAA